MATVTLAESAKLDQDDLVAGVIESMITVNQMFELLPFSDVEGNSKAYNRENVLGDVQALAVGGTITAKAAATFTQVTVPLTTLIGDAEVNKLIQRTRSNKNDQKAIQIASKAKSIARQFQQLMITGDGVAPNFEGLLSLVSSSKLVEAGANGAALDLDDVDEALDSVTDKDGQVDFIMSHARTRRAYMKILRATGGITPADMFDLPSGDKVISYRGIPWFRNDYMPIDQTHGGGSALTTLLCGTFDDGSESHGIAGLNAEGGAGIEVEPVGTHQSKDEDITRVKMYTAMALYSLNGLAGVYAINN